MTLNPTSPDTFAGSHASALYLPLGMMSPLWMLFASAASFGMAFWWMSRFAMLSPLDAIPVREPPLAPGRPKLLLVESTKPVAGVADLPAIATAH